MWHCTPDTRAEQISKAEVVQEASKQFPIPAMSSIINNTPGESFVKYSIRHRLNTNPELLVNGSVTVVGDAAHPCTPNMGQGGCMALEDALILTQKLYGTLKTDPKTHQDLLSVPEHERIHRALVEFQLERHDRTHFIATRSYRIGKMTHLRWTVVEFFRDWFLIPLFYKNKTFLAHTLFDVGKLPG